MRCLIAGAILSLAPGVLSPGPALAQHSYTKAEVENGWRLFQASCVVCHGPKGDAVRGVALLSGRFQRVTTDDELMRIVQGGIPGTPMPPNPYSDIEAGMIVAYMRGIAGGESLPSTSGDAGRGRTVFEGKGDCASCHNESSRTAPSL